MSLLFIFPPLGSSPLARSPALTQPILFTLFHSLQTSRPLSLSSLWSAHSVSRSYSGRGARSVWPGWGGGRQHLISYLRINHEVLSTQSSSDPSGSLSQPASSRHAHTPLTNVHSSHQPTFIPQPQWYGKCAVTMEAAINIFHY